VRKQAATTIEQVPGARLASLLIPLKNQKEQDVAPQIVRVCTARRDNTVIFDLAMEYLDELLIFS
jgi:hypothetical protein